MTTNTPDPADPYEEAGLPATDDALPGKLITGDVQDDVVVPNERPLYVDEYGTTDREESLGEPLGGRLARENPDVLNTLDQPWSDQGDEGSAEPYPVDPEERVGRLVDQEDGAYADQDPDLFAQDVGTDSGGFSAEERAMHVDPDS
jgi:hypothetical protein